MTESKTAAELREKLDTETGLIGWPELIKHFARGVVIVVEPNIELVDAALVFATDDTNKLERWLTERTVSKATDDHARDWTQREPDFKCVVAAPWVLVQEQPVSPLLH